MNTGSFILSLLLHLGALAFLLYAPAHKPVDLTRPSVQVSLVMGLPGGENLPSPVLGHRPPEAEKQVLSTESAPKPEAVQEPAPSAPEIAEIPRPEDLRQDMPQPEPDPVRQPQPDEQRQPEPQQIARAQEAVPIPRPDAQPEKKAEPKPEPKKAPEPEKKPEPKPEQKKAPEPEKKPDPKPEKKPAEKAEKKPAGPVNPAADALADARKQAHSASGKGSGKGSAAASALKDLARELGGKTGVGGGGGQGDGPGGGGIYDVYAGLVIEAVRPNWSIPVMSRSNMVVQVRIELDRNGKVLDCTIERSSGRPDFDASAVNAVQRTSEKGMFPKPPTRAQQDILITFNSQDLIR
jgi:colicin import membrane protein